MTGWRDHAACIGHPVDWWFPEVGEQNQRQHVLARQICTGCPVRIDCLRYAVEAREESGIWGGLGIKAREAWAAAEGIRPVDRRTVLPPIHHGTASGYLQHRRRNETACGDCREAWAREERRRKAQRREAS